MRSAVEAQVGVCSLAEGAGREEFSSTLTTVGSTLTTVASEGASGQGAAGPALSEMGIGDSYLTSEVRVEPEIGAKQGAAEGEEADAAADAGAAASVALPVFRCKSSPLDWVICKDGCSAQCEQSTLYDR